MPGPLDGVRVLEFTLVVAGPMSGVLLSDLGADVIKVEPPGGESTRQALPGLQPRQARHRRRPADARGARGHPPADATIDVAVANYRYGVPDRIGIGYETLKQYRPDLIYVESTGFGTRGELAQRGCSDVVAQAYSGIMAGDAKVAEDGAPMAASFGAPAGYSTARSPARPAPGPHCCARSRRGEGGPPLRWSRDLRGPIGWGNLPTPRPTMAPWSAIAAAGRATPTS